MKRINKEYLYLFFSFLTTLFINWGKKGIKNSHFDKILVVKLDHIGDVVTATPVFEALKNRYPEAHVSLLLGSWSKDVVKNNPNIDELILYDSSSFMRNKQRKHSLTYYFNILRTIRLSEFKLIIDLRGDWFTLILAVLSKCTFRLDRGTVRFKKKISKLFNRFSENTTHEVICNLEIVQPLGIKLHQVKTKIYLTNEEMDEANTILKHYGISENDTLIVIHPGAPWKPRRWSVRKFVNIANWCVSKKNAKVVLIGGHDEIMLKDHLTQFIDKRVIVLIGQTNLRQTMSIINRATMLVCNDSGPMHLASALGTPVVALFGPENPNKFGPWGSNNIVLHKKVDCFPCKQKTCTKADNTCVNLITESEVKKAIESILGETI
mgnify:CR=1 FL=1